MSVRLGRNVRKLIFWGGGALLAVAVLAGALAYAFFQIFYPAPPSPNFPPPHSLADAQRQDLDYFRHYLDYNKAYTPAKREKAGAMLAAYEAKAGTLSSAQFELAIASMVALSDNGHSADYEGAFRRRHNKLPCMLYHFSDGYYIVRARPACRSLLGARLLAVDGHGTTEIADRAYEYARGPRNHFDQFVTPFYLESPALLNAMGLAKSPDRVTLRVQMPDGSLREVPMAADPPDPKWSWWTYSDSYLSPQPAPTDGADWKPYLSADAKVPLFIADYGNPFHTAHWPGIFYASFRSNEDETGHPIAPFVDEVTKEIAAQNPRIVIVDLRFDQGGDMTTTADIMSHITTLAPSIRHVYILTSAWTFSAGEISAALAKAHGGDKVTILGTAVGDRLRFWAEGQTMTLPNSQIMMHYATGLHDYTKSCWAERGCFWTMLFYPMHLKTLAPDMTIPYSFADYRALRDPVLDYVLHSARGKAL